MTDLAFYAELDALATELLTDFGILTTYREVTTAKPNASGKVVPTTQDFPGLGVRLMNRSVVEVLNLTADVVFVWKGPAEPIVGGLVVHAGGTWRIEEVRLSKPVGAMLVAFLGAVAAT